MLDNARLEVALAARRLDSLTVEVKREARSVGRTAKRVSPALILGGGLAVGLVAVLVPASLRKTAFLGVGQFVLRRFLG